MADAKISALPSATTPLAGAEEVPIVQSGSTKKVSVANLTAGRDVSINNLGLGGTAPVSYAAIEWAPTGSVTYGAELTPDLNTNTSNVQMFRARVRSTSSTHTDITAFYAGLDGLAAGSTTTTAYGFRATNPSGAVTNLYGFHSGIADASGAYNFYASGDAPSYSAGNYHFAAAKGINFTANTPASGMTSQLLNWYEEGTWTPTLQGGTSAGSYTVTTSSALYTRVGRLVTVTARMVITVNSAGTGYAKFGGLPFSKGASQYFAGTVGLTNVTFAASVSGIVAQAETAGASSNFYLAGNRSGTAQYDVDITDFVTNSSVIISLSYYV